MSALPNSLALVAIQDGALEVAADHRNNYAAVQAAVNALIAALSGGVAGQVLESAGASSVAYAYQGGVYRKSTAKTINNSVAETDLLNGEITVGANVMGTSSVLRLTAEGDLLNNTGGTVTAPRFKLKLGATTLLDTNALAGAVTTSAARFGWKIVCEIADLGATNSQWASIDGSYTSGVATGAVAFATGEGYNIANNVVGGVGLTQFKGSNSGAVDMTANQALVLSVILGAASANHEIVLKRALVEVI